MEIIFSGHYQSGWRPELEIEEAYLTLCQTLISKGLITVEDLELNIVGYNGFGYFRDKFGEKIES